MGIEPEPEELDTSDDLDLVTVFSSDKHTSEMEAIGIQSILESGGISSVIVGGGVIPSIPFEVRVPRARLEEALRLIAESEAAGPRAAEEAERASEGGQ
jgi:hypothetical protein